MTPLKWIAQILVLGIALVLAIPAVAAEKPLRIKPSKVSSAKGREREKQFTEWQSVRDFGVLVDKKSEAGEDLLYFEYREGKDQMRGIFTKAINFDALYYSYYYGEKEMEKEVQSQKSRDLEPLFIVLEGNYYCMVFVPPAQIAPARKILEGLGIEAPVVK